ETYFGRLTALADQYEQAIKAEASAQELTAIQSKISHVMQHYDNVISSSEAFGWLMIDVRRTSFKSRYVGPLHFQSQRDGLVAAESVSISATHAEIQREFDRIKKKYLAPRESISASPHDNTP
ncbi:MAG: hypothetical protein EBX40_07670, partial [Gammaproteobacteria bacterium]|nr:hypothetical protein [Gammaproteobacteria bacterium]